jgi:hypothetical protein
MIGIVSKSVFKKRFWYLISTVRFVCFRYLTCYGVTLNPERAVSRTHYEELELTLVPT